MRSFYNRQDPVIFWSIFIACLIGISTLLLWGVEYQNLPSEIPLFFSLPWGDAQLINPKQFTVLPAIILLFILINSILIMSLHPSQWVLKRIISAATAMVALLITITAFRIVFIFI